jgi:hypothetical protein
MTSESEDFESRLTTLETNFATLNKNTCDALGEIIDILVELRDKDCELPPGCDDDAEEVE